MSGPCLNSVKAEQGDVILSFREWDGIDRPNYTTVRLSASQWNSWMRGEFVRVQTEANAQMLQLKNKRIATLQAQLDQGECEIASLRRQIRELVNADQQGVDGTRAASADGIASSASADAHSADHPAPRHG